jgi:hypothetical protein
MHDLDDIDEKFPDGKLAIDIPPENERTGKPGRSTGPVSPNGKAKSSMNALTHGCRSEKSVLPHEDAAEFEFTVQIWLDAYHPEDPIAETLVLDAAKAHWIFKRNQTYYEQIASRLPADAWHWTDENLKLYEKFTRYKTTAERSFYRAFNTLEAHYKRQSGRAAQAEKVKALIAKASLQWAKRKSEAEARGLTVKQLVDVLPDGPDKCVTTLMPTNEQVAVLFSNDDPPLYVLRYIMFSFGVPPAYEWTNPSEVHRNNPSYAVQHFTYSDWLKQIEAERAAGAGHLTPAAALLLLDPDASLPRS